MEAGRVKKGTLMFIIFAVAWQIVVGLLYGFFFTYNESSLTSMEGGNSVYSYASTSGTTTNFLANTTQFPFPLIVVALAIILLIVGLSMVAGYIQRSAVTGMAFTLLIFALTIQNFFIFRTFWSNISVNDPNATANFPNTRFSIINFINFGNDMQKNYQLPSASFLDAVGAALAMYAGYTGVIGRIGLGEIFFLTWIGTFIYELNSQILWRLFIPDNGYPSRAFAYGGVLGIVSSLILSKRQKTKDNPNFRSSYKIMALAFLGIIFVWCSYPILVLSNVYISTTGKIVAMAGQVNIWLALAASALGCYTASALTYSKFCVHDLVFAAITGGIAFSSSTEINYNPGAATAIGFITGFIVSFSQTRFKRKINENGVIDSNSVFFNFIIPSLFAAIFSAILQGVGLSASSATTYTYTTTGQTTTFSTSQTTLSSLIGRERNQTIQGGYQIIGWLISVGLGAIAGLIIGFIYRLLNDSFDQANDQFNDGFLYQYAKINGEGDNGNNQEQPGQPEQPAQQAKDN